jgi:acyl-coenzyme A thioesterase PaaI-like protein
VTTAADAAVLGRVTAELEAAAGVLAEELPPVPFPRFADPEHGHPGAGEDLAALAGTPSAMPFDMVIGRYNPVAPPVTVETDLGAVPPKAIGVVTFGTIHEGAPGCVHGAVIAGVFDIVLTVANRLSGAAGPTTRLSYRFRRPTLLGHECRFEGWVVERDDRRVTSHGRLVQGGHVTVEAEGRFAIFTPEEVRELSRRVSRR